MLNKKSNLKKDVKASQTVSRTSEMASRSILQDSELISLLMTNALEGRQRQKNLYKVIVVLLVVLIVFAISDFYTSQQKIQSYHYITENGKVTRIYPVEQAVWNDEEITNWSIKKMSKSLHFDAVHWKEQLSEAQRDFTVGGYESYMDALAESTVLEEIKRVKGISKAVITGETPTIYKQGVSQKTGQYYWRVSIPILFSIESAVANPSYQMIVEMAIVRTANEKNEDGIAIHQINIKQK